MSSLYDPLGVYLRDSQYFTQPQWDACRNWIKEAAKSATPGGMTAGDFTITLTKGE